ncbi:hypothetical protein BCV70DRAFT_200663 [Testicularia cyperi]|uniref:GST N-terminal domain-containing protein n=1 Tax=Testicularia cyperi TaxID=1882483 RepID=A0A317XPF4_9BASI|nr:hypothetical protein BCV70DRAFT_200663 [Testicularia cyperi]
MSSSNSRVVVYGYASSPFFQKIGALLNHYGVDWTLVEVPPVMPRPMLSKLLGITYRRIPVVFVDGHAYVDTSAAAIALDRAFGSSNNKSLFDTMASLQLQLAVNWAESPIFRLSAGHLFKAPLNDTFIKDRKSFMPGASFEPAKMEANIPFVRSQLVTHLEAVESHLSSSKFLLGDRPQYLDFALFTPLNWVQTQLKTGDDLLPPVSSKDGDKDWSSFRFPKTLTWLAAVRKHIAANKAKSTKSSPEDAAKLIVSQSATSSSSVQSKIDPKDPLVKGGWINGQSGQTVAVTPTDTGRVPQVGNLFALDNTSVTIKVKTALDGKDILATFPRLNFDIRAVDSAKL